VRRLLALAGLLTAVALPIASAPATPVPPGFASPNVEWLANVPLHADTAGGRLVGKNLYVLDSRGFAIYDLTNPELPVPVGVTALPEVPYYPQEDMDTNGIVAIVGQGSPNPANMLFVFDVHEKSNPTLIATLAGAGSHTVSCVLNCTWVYESNGKIVDLRDPKNPKLAGNWQTGTDVKEAAHDVTEVAPGFVMTSSKPILYLDARRNPAHPRVIGHSIMPDKRFIHANLWPRDGADRWLLVGGETADIPCSSKEGGAFMTYDTKDLKRTGKMRMVDDWRAPDTLPTEGGSPVETFCSHWFTTRPGYKNGGLVTAGWYEHGTRFLQVSPTGKITEKGWFIPAGTTASGAYWVTKDILYVLDYQRGLDILRWHDTANWSGQHGATIRGLAPWQAPTTSRTWGNQLAVMCGPPRSAAPVRG
jgi:hypothetical protein